MLHTLYQQNVRANTQFFVEWTAQDLIRDENGDVVGVTAMEMETGEVYIFHAKAVMFATGGGGRIYASSTNAYMNTGEVWVFAPAQVFRWKIWNSGNSIRPVWQVQAC